MAHKISVRSNKKARTFTIRRYDVDGQLVAKYRTIPYSKEEFDNMENNTENDWDFYLRSTDEYYKVL